MVIKGFVANVYDIEVFPNCFHATVRDTETNKLHLFEISARKVQIQELCDYFSTKNAIFVGYNNHHYDDLLVNYIIEYQTVMANKSYSDICKSLFNMSQIIVNSDESDDSHVVLKHWKYAKYFKSMDILTMLFSKKLRVGLKEMQMTMHYKNVEEYSGDFTKDILTVNIDKMIEYNINDVDSTYELLQRCEKDISVRLWAEDEYHIKALSMDSVKLGETILAKTYCNKTGISMKQLEGINSPMDYIPLKNVVFSFIDYKNPILKAVLEDMKAQVVYSKERKGYEKKFVLSNVRYSVGVGGLHTLHKPEIFVPKSDEYIGHVDVTSMYPSLLIQYKLTPRHLGEHFWLEYKKIYNDRIEAKHSGQKDKNLALKLTLNSVTGKMQQETSWMYDPLNVFRIRINGQLILLMLIERLIELGCKIVQANTDGVMFICKKSNQDKVQEVVSDIEHLTKLSFEAGRYEAFYQYAINDYIGVIEGYSISHDPKLIETKGMFITKTNLGKGLSPTIIPKAVINYLVNSIPIQDTIKSCTDIREFLMGQRVSKDFEIEYCGRKLQHINRFYASTNGAYLFKYKTSINGEKQYFNMLTKSGVTILDKFDNVPIEQRKINYTYYIREASKIVADLKTVQLELF